MKNISMWSDTTNNEVCKSLDKDLEVDVLIIGGGMTGISAAYQLSNSILKVCLVEKNEVASGVTSRTTGKLSYIQENLYSKISKYLDKKTAKLYLESQIDAINIVKDIIKKNKIDCDLESVKSYIIDNKNSKFEEEKRILKELNVNIYESNTLPNGKKIGNLFYVDNTYVFHPLKYLYKLKDIILKRDVLVYENTKVTSINKEDKFYECKTDKYSIKAKYVVLALHYPYFLIPFWMPLKAYIEKSYIEAFKVEKNYKFSSITITKPTISTRYHTDNNKTYQLVLTNSHNACIKENDKENFNSLLKNGEIKAEYLWSNKDIMTNDSIPFIGSINGDNTLLIGTGYNTWGMTNGTIAGKILADIILKKENKYIKLFNPLRKINTGKIINFPLILGSNAYSFIKSKIKKQKHWYSENVRFEKRNGRDVAIYTDDAKKEHIVYTICPHMKCSLIFNEIEHTWDCPCHGSRFDIDGNSIEGPSNYNISYKE